MSTKTPARQVATLRARIAALQAERASLLASQRCRADVAALVESMVQRWQETGARSILRELRRAGQGAAPDLLSVSGAAAVVRAPGEALFRVDLAPLLVSLIGADKVRAALLAAIDDVPEGMPAEDRVQRLADIATELDALETEEEALIDASDLTDSPIPRRPDARPEIVLAG